MTELSQFLRFSYLLLPLRLVEFSVRLRTLLLQGLSEHEFYSDLV